MTVRLLGALVLGVIMATAAPLGASAQEASIATEAGVGEATDTKSCGPPLLMLADRLDAIRTHYTGARMRLMLAAFLSIQETAIGIDDEQQPAWRAYTRALLEMVPERERVLALIGSPDEDPPQAFERAEALADALIVYGAKAQALKTAIADLRGTLSPAQLDTARLPRLQADLSGLLPF